MCRARPCQRRCRDHQTPQQRFQASARQRMSRYARQCDAALDRGDVKQAERCERLMNKALDDMGCSRTTPARCVTTTAMAYTEENTAHWGDAELEQALANSWDDPQAVDQLMHLIDQRDAQRKLDEKARADHERAMAEWCKPWANADPITSTTASPSRRLTATEQARAEYETYVDVQWLQAESDCNGVLLTAEARAKGIDSRSLFSGNFNRAVKYASPELQSWWQANGRLSMTAFRHQMLGRESDRGAAEQARYQSYDAVAW